MSEELVIHDEELKELTLNERRRRHYGLFRLGQEVKQISRATGYGEETVRRDIMWCRKNGGIDPLMRRGDVFAAIWTELEFVKSEAYGGWVRSQVPVRIEKTKKVVTAEETREEHSVETREQAGDPRFRGIVETVVQKQAILAGFVSDGQSGRAATRVSEVDDDDTVAIVEVANREEARKLSGKKFCRLAISEDIIEGKVADGEAEESPQEV